MTDPLGQTLRNTYDDQFRVVEQQQFDGTSVVFEYAGDPSSAEGGQTTMTDSRGNKTVDVYRNMLLMSVTVGADSAAAETRSYIYDLATLGVTSATDDRGTTTSSYDAHGNRVSQTDATNATTTTTFDLTLDLPTKIVDPLGGTTELAYDGAGNLLRATDPTGIVTTLEYDDDQPGQVNERTRGEARTSFRYDEHGNAYPDQGWRADDRAADLHFDLQRGWGRGLLRDRQCWCANQLPNCCGGPPARHDVRV